MAVASMRHPRARGVRWLLRSKPFRRVYGVTLVGLAACFVIIRGLEWLREVETPGHGSSRELLSGGGEIIPGFSGECNHGDVKKQADWEMDSYCLGHVILTVYLFLGIAIICDEQFTSSLESICNPRTGLGLSPDVAGATFMAAGSSAPELASSFMGTFVSKSDVGLGTIIGSAVFNILIIIGATAIVVGEPMQLDWKPLGRDVCFYCGSVVLLIGFVAGDKKVAAWEAGALLVYYALYILWMVYNTGLMRSIAKMVGDTKEVKAPKSRRPSFSTGFFSHDEKKDAPDGAPEPSAASTPAEGTGSGKGVVPGSALPSMGDDGMTVVELGTSSHFGQGSGSAGDGGVELPGATPTMGDMAASAEDAPAAPTAPAGDVEKGGEKQDEGEEEEEGVADMVCNVLSIPFIVIFDWTMPDCKYEDPTDEEADEEIEKLQEESATADAARKAEITEEIAGLEKQKELRAQIDEAEENEEDEKVEKLQKELFAMYEPLTWQQRYYLVTFVVSLIHITWLSYFMVTFMEKIGCAWGISSFIMGITFLAMGTSVPDALGSIAVAKEGEGDMAVSNAIGSNVFDICIGLGLPWMIVTIIDGEGKSIKAATESIVASTVILFLVVVVLFASLWSSKHPESQERFCLYPMVGWILFGSYGAFVIFQLIWVGAGLPE